MFELRGVFKRQVFEILEFDKIVRREGEGEGEDDDLSIQRNETRKAKEKD